ncbi:MAG: transcription initiation factor TFIID subunit TAF5 [Amphiamblys sp. WSBS2006]|nr:MAG: transcription initiation factor TFIID subunit TAF5 [Amphiamblys sp. WSBS2006]
MSGKALGGADDALESFVTRMGYTQDHKEKTVENIGECVLDLRTDQSFGGWNGLFPLTGESATMHEVQYAVLMNWAENSLDIYREELQRVLFPLLVHSYIDLIDSNEEKRAVHMLHHFSRKHSLSSHESELLRLGSVLDKLQLKENQFCLLFRRNKYIAPLSQHSFHLLVHFIQENKLDLMQKILNQFVDVRIVPQTSKTEELGIAGLVAQSIPKEKESVLWGGLYPPRVTEEEVCAYLSRNPSQLISQLKTNIADCPSEDSPAKDRVPLPKCNDADILREAEKLRDLTQNTPSMLPSICCYSLHAGENSLVSLSFSRDCGLAVGGFQDSFVGVWSLENAPLRKARPSIELAAINLTETATVDDLFEDGDTRYRRLVGHRGPVYSAQLTEDNRFVFSSSQDSTVRLWSLFTFDQVCVYRGHQCPVWDVKVGPFGHYFVSGGADRTARLWTADRTEAVRLFTGHVSDVDVVCFHPNSNYVGSGSSDKTCRLWDIQTGRCVRIFTGLKSGPNSLEISPDGKYIACSAEDGEVCVWEIGSGKKVFRVEAVAKVRCVAFSPRGSRLTYATASGDLVHCDFLGAGPEQNYKTRSRDIRTLHYVNSNLLSCFAVADLC